MSRLMPPWLSPPTLSFLVAIGLSGCDGPQHREKEQPPRIRELSVEERPNIPPLSDARWFLTDFGWIIATDNAGIDSVGIEMQSAVRTFAIHFESVPGRGAIIDLGLAQHASLLKKAGAEWVMHWQRPGLDRIGIGQTLPPARELRHELGHLFFMTCIWPNTRGYQYGGDAPDWLDEAAAVLMETPVYKRQRRSRFGDMDSAGRLIPLADYLTMIHPFFNSPAMRDLLLSRQGMDKPERRIFFAELSPETHTLEIDFYAQTRGFIDFLLEITGDDRVFLEIAQFLKAGGTMDGWLAESATARAAGLGGSVEVLERRWRDWVETLYRGH